MFRMRSRSALFLAMAFFGPFVTFADTPTLLRTQLRPAAKDPSFGLKIQYGSLRYNQYQFVGHPNTQVQNRSHSLHLGAEWLPIREAFGSLGIGLGVSFFTLRNVSLGAFPKDTGGQEERFASLTTVPVELQLHYLGRFIPRQFIVPSFRVGPSYTFAIQSSTSGGTSANRSFYGLEFGAGIQILLDTVEGTSAHDLKRTTGIRATYLAIEYGLTRSLGVSTANPINLSGDVIRAGLRFEL